MYNMEMPNSKFINVLTVFSLLIFAGTIGASTIGSLKDALNLAHNNGKPVLIQFIHED